MKEVTIENVIRESKVKNKYIDEKTIIKAYEYAREKHKNQYRKSGEPYIIHPINVAYILANLGLDTETICAALLHDVEEDTDATYEDIEKNFGQEIAQMVEGVTKLTNLFKTSDETKAENYKKMFSAMEKDIRVIILKLADRLHNILTLEYLKKDRQIAIAKETIEVYAPIAHKLGMNDLKRKLQDGAFKYLYPEEYNNIKKRTEGKLKRCKALLECTKNRIDKSLNAQGILTTTCIQTKCLYDIYRKTKEKDRNINELKDLFSIKILTNKKSDCYKILGVINSIYKVIPHTFKDYIAIPRNNMYQSINEILIGEKGVIFEVKISTYEMNKIAKYGVVNYLKQVNINNNKEIDFEKNLYGIYDTLELKKIDKNNSKEFLDTLKNELIDDEIYIFTPKGDIKVLPKESTPIDFAYAIHNEIGKHITACKINSMDMPITKRLENGNIVEIITSNKEIIPNVEWIDIVKTAKAKSQIIKQLKKNAIEKNIVYTLEINTINKDGLVLEITEAFNKHKINIISLETKTIQNKVKIKIKIAMDNKNIKKLKDTLNIVLKIKNVKSIEIKD